MYDSLLTKQYHQIRFYIDSGEGYLHLNANTIDTLKCEYLEYKSASGSVTTRLKKKIWYNNKLVWDLNTSKGSDLITIIK